MSLALPKPTHRQRERRPLRRTSRPRARRATTRASLIREANRLFRDMVLRAAGQRCEHCSRAAVDPAHGVNRNRLAVCWDWSNVFALCRECHDYFHAYPERWREWRVQRVGRGEVERVERIANEKKHVPTYEIKELLFVMRVEDGLYAPIDRAAQNQSVRRRGLVGREVNPARAGALLGRVEARIRQGANL